ncbi:MAG: hypothetical protein KIG91_05155 [Treponema sp.]|nr:hypothetical protein [Treponema sp.]
MKKNLLLITGAITLGAMLSGCSFVVPKKYKVVTNAEYNFTLAKMNKDLSSMMNFDEMFSSEDPDSKIKMYQYNPNGESNVRQLLMEMPVGDPVELDMGEYIQNDLYNGEPISVEQIIEMPDISVEPGEIDLAEKISEELCSIIKFGGPIIAEASVTNAPASDEEDFSEFEFSAGSLNVYVKNATGASGVELYYNDELVSSANFEQKNSETKNIQLSGMPDEVSFSPDWVAEIPLSGKSLHKEGMKIKFKDISYTKKNQLNWSSDDIFIADLSSDAKISKANGVTAKRDNINIGEQIVPFSLEKVSDVVIGKGLLKTELVKGNSSGGKCDLNYSFATSGALEITDGSGTVDLQDKDISNQDLKIIPTASLDFKNATLDLSELKFTYSCSIDEIASVKVNLTELAPDFDPHKDEGKPLTDDVTKMVSEIWFDESNFEITYTNTLPEGNDIDLELNSTFLNIDKKITLTAGKTDKDASFKAPRDDVTLPGKPTKNGEDNATVDFTADIELPEYYDDGVNKTCVLKNVVPSKKDEEPQKYKLCVNVVPHIDWSEALVDLSDSDMDKSDEVDTQINFGSMMSALGDDFCRNVKIDSVPVYIYSEKPDMDAFKDVSIGGKITVIGADSVDLLKEGETLDLSKNRPDLNLDETGKIAQIDLSKIESACSGDIASTISFSSNDSLKIKYDIHIAGINGEKNIRMQKADLDGKKTSLANYAYIVIPFVFNVSSDTDMAMPGLGDDSNDGEKNDLFGRSEAPTESSMLSFLDAVESFTIFMTSSHIPFYYDPSENKENKSVEFVMDLDSDGFDDDPLNLENGSYKMSREDIKGAFEAYPYSPSVKIRFPSGQMSILSDMTLESRIDFQLKTDGEFTLNGSKNGNN